LKITGQKSRKVIFVHIPSVFCTGGRNISANYKVSRRLIINIGHTTIHTFEPVVPDHVKVR